MELSRIAKNKVVFYLGSRYLTYFIKFVTSLIIAVKLGPFYMGIWGAILLILNYFQQCHFGIAYSFPIFYVQNKDDEDVCFSYALNSIALLGFLSIFVFLTYAFFSVFENSFFVKYHIYRFYLWICIIAVLQYYQDFFLQLFRVKNKIVHVTVCQSLVVILNFFCAFFFEQDELIWALLAGYLLGLLLCCLLAFFSKDFTNIIHAKLSFKIQRKILKKGIFLFVYGACFYFIFISIRTIISNFYGVEEFGLFTFSYTVANAFFLLFGAISFLITPKLLVKLSSDDRIVIAEAIHSIRTVMITSSHLLIYLAIILFPVLLYFIPKYESSITSFNLVALAILMNSNVTGYSELLLARNREKCLALLSFGALIINLLLGVFLAKFMQLSYDLIVLATLVAYSFYSFTVVYVGEGVIHKNMITHLIRCWFPLRLAVPYCIAILICILNMGYMYRIFLLLFFVVSNMKSYRIIKPLLTRIVNKPDVVDL